MTDNYIKTKKILELYAPSSVRAKIKRARKVGKYVGGTTGAAATLALPIPGATASGALAGSKVGGRWVGARAIAKDKGTKIKSIKQIKDAGKIAKSTAKAVVGTTKHIAKSTPKAIKDLSSMAKKLPGLMGKLPGAAKKLSKYAMTKRLLRTR